MGKFILNRTDERATKSVGRIVLYGLLFLIITRLVLILLANLCAKIYMKNGIDVMQMLQFFGNPENAVSTLGKWMALFMVAIWAPVTEEAAFRLGLSFKKLHIAIGLGVLGFTFAGFIPMEGSTAIIVKCAAAIVIFCAVYFATNDSTWQKIGSRYRIPIIYIMAIGFGLMHLFAMSLSLLTLPYALIICLQPMFMGFVASYYRINLGFLWAVGVHILGNVPGIIMILTM